MRERWKQAFWMLVSAATVLSVAFASLVLLNTYPDLLMMHPGDFEGQVELAIVCVAIYLAAVRWIERRPATELSPHHALRALAAGSGFLADPPELGMRPAQRPPDARLVPTQPRRPRVLVERHPRHRHRPTRLVAWMYSAAAFGCPRTTMRPSRVMSRPTEIMFVASATSTCSLSVAAKASLRFVLPMDIRICSTFFAGNWQVRAHTFKLKLWLTRYGGRRCTLRSRPIEPVNRKSSKPSAF